MTKRTVLLGGGWLILAAAMGFQEKAGRPINQKPKPPTPEFTVMTIHCGFQMAYDDLSKYESKTLKSRDGYGQAFSMQVPTKKPSLTGPSYAIVHNHYMRQTNVPFPSPSLGYSISYYAVGAFGRALGKSDLQVDHNIGPYAAGLRPADEQLLIQFAARALAESDHSETLAGTLAGMESYAHAIRATNKECLSCHSDSKVGDPLAILIYTVKRKKV